MDLRVSYPRSARDQLLGVVQLARSLDKAKAAAAGTLGEYKYNCKMDQHIFAFLGIDHEELVSAIKGARDDREIEDFLRPYVARKTPAEIAHWNAEWVEQTPSPGTEAYENFMAQRNAIAPDRTDVVRWVDLLDLDEKREVPRRTGVA